MITANKAVALIASPHDVVGVSPLVRVVNTCGSYQLRRLTKHLHPFPKGGASVLEIVSVGVVVHDGEPQQKPRVGAESSGVQVGSNQERREEPIHSVAILFPRLHHWF